MDKTQRETKNKIKTHSQTAPDYTKTPLGPMISLWRGIQYTDVPDARRSVKEASSNEFRSCPGQLELFAFRGASAAGGYVGSSHQTAAQQFGGVGDSDEVAHDSNVSLGNHINTRPA